MRNQNILFILSFLLLSCQSKDVRNKLIMMRQKKIEVDVSGMKCVNLGEKSTNQINSNSRILVVYSDTSNCSQCYIDRLCMWNDLLVWEDKYPDFKFQFVIQARKNESDILERLLKSSKLKHDVYIDDKSRFIKTNPHIPDESMFHVFLLDKEGHVVIVGNPLYNERIERMIIDALSDSIISY